MAILTPPRPPSQDGFAALIREARQRQRRRRLTVAVFVALVAAVGLATTSLLAGLGSAGARSKYSAGLAAHECQLAQLTIKEIPISNPTGLDRTGLQLTNRSSACSLRGYPVIRFSDANGTIPFLFRYLGKPQTVTVPEGHSIFSIFSKFRCDIGTARSTERTSIGLPKQGQDVVLRGGLGGPSICRPGITAEGRWLTLTPFGSLTAAYRVSLIGNGTGP